MVPTPKAADSCETADASGNILSVPPGNTAVRRSGFPRLTPPGTPGAQAPRPPTGRPPASSVGMSELQGVSRSFTLGGPRVDCSGIDMRGSHHAQVTRGCGTGSEHAVDGGEVPGVVAVVRVHPTAAGSRLLLDDQCSRHGSPLL